MKKLMTLLLAFIFIGANLVTAQELIDTNKEATLDSIFLFEGSHLYLNSVKVDEDGIDKFLATYLNSDTEVAQMIVEDIENLKDNLKVKTGQISTQPVEDLTIEKIDKFEIPFPHYPFSTQLELITYHLDEGLYQYSSSFARNYSPYNENGGARNKFIYFDLEEQLIFTSDYLYVIAEDTTYLTVAAYQMNNQLDIESITKELNERGVNNHLNKKFYSDRISFSKIQNSQDGLKGNFIRLFFVDYEEDQDNQDDSQLVVSTFDIHGNEQDFILLWDEDLPLELLENNRVKGVEGELAGFIDFKTSEQEEVQLPQIEVHRWGSIEEFLN